MRTRQQLEQHCFVSWKVESEIQQLVATAHVSGPESAFSWSKVSEGDGGNNSLDSRKLPLDTENSARGKLS